MKKSDREIMEILEAFDATGCAHSAAGLAGVDAKTVRRYVARREAGVPVDELVRRPKLIDPFVPKIEEAESAMSMIWAAVDGGWATKARKRGLSSARQFGAITPEYWHY